MRSPTDSGRRVAALIALAALAAVALIFASPAEAGRYTVAQCDPANRAHADAVFERRNGGDYGFAHRCDEAAHANSLQVRTITGAPAKHFGRVSWAAPTGSRLVAVALEARLRSHAGQEARLGFLDAAGNEVARLATGRDRAGGFKRYERALGAGGRERFAAGLTCTKRPRCAHSTRAKAWVRSVRLTVEDRIAPAVTLSGSLLRPGWQRGSETLAAIATDAGSGVRRVEVALGRRQIAPSQTFDCAVIAGTALTSRMRPCAERRRVERTVDTRTAPFVNGVNRLSVCAHDYGTGGAPGCVQRFLMVDNGAPEVAFSNGRDREDPELIRALASDRHSGLARGTIAYRPLAGGSWRVLPTEHVRGELRARVDSATEPAGRYLFRVSATDEAGNAAQSTERANGSRMVLSFPLRERTSLDASIEGRKRLTVDYGERPDLGGVLRGAAGKPVAGQRIAVVERFDSGSSLEPIVRHTSTDRRGRFSLRLSRGPSRRVVARYEGSRRYLASEPQTMRLKVRGSAKLRISARRVKAGRDVVFRGTIGRFGAALPRAGKLVELQVRGGGIRRYRTVREAFRTDSAGRWKLRYRFDRFYERPTRFRFRARVTPESGWPYLGPAHSAARPLVVEPKRRR